MMNDGENTQRNLLDIHLSNHRPFSLAANAWRFNSNALQRVFSSIHPIINPTRQIPLNAYARRLHARHVQRLQRYRRAHAQMEAQRNAQQPERILNSDEPTQYENPNGPVLVEQLNPVVINIEDSDLNSSYSGIPEYNLLPVTSASESTQDRNDNESLSDDSEANGATESDNRNHTQPIMDLLAQYPEVRQALVHLWHYCVFFLIIFAKTFFDHFAGFVAIFTLAIGFFWSNQVVRRNVLSHNNDHLKQLLLIFVTVPIGFFFMHHFFIGNPFNSVLLLPLNVSALNVGDLLWIVLVSDYIVKLTTVYVKAVISVIPQSFLHFHSRGKYFIMVEMISQLYRSLVPIQPWLTYLLDEYTGPRKVMGVFFSALYMICKGPDVLCKLKNLQAACTKFCRSMNFGVMPTKTQLQDSGGVCPICHDNFLLPTMLECKHIFCEECVISWFNRERTCPLCRAQVADDPAWKDGTTSHVFQLY